MASDSVRFTPFTIDVCEAFVGGDVGKNMIGQHVIATRHGHLTLTIGCWIMKHPDGTFTTQPEAPRDGG